MSDLREDFVDALADFEAALELSTAANQAAARRAGELRQLLAQGRKLSDVVLAEERPLIVELASENVQRLYDAGGRLRRIEARALHEDGLTMDVIASLFGVSRQRVSTLINDAR